MPAELVFVVFGVAEGIICTKYFEMYLSLSSDEVLGVLRVREGVEVDPLEPPGVLRVREGAEVDPLEPPGVLRVREGVEVDPLEPPGVL